MLSLLLSAALVYMSIIVLGRQVGFTLSLAGFAGFIVSLGVAAASFVIPSRPSWARQSPLPRACLATSGKR